MKSPRPSEARKIADAIAADADALCGLLDDANSVMWERPRHRGQSEGPRPRGVFGDPTGEVAIDPRRLRIREAFQRAIVEYVRAYDQLNAARADLEGALENWRS